jgi:DNA-binding MarR family transcriptional regulator
MSSSRPSSPGSLEQLGWLIKKVQHGHHRALDAALAPLGVSLVQWNALREIDRHPGCSQHQLAEATFNSDQALGTLLGRLHRMGLILRERGSGRAQVHQLTQRGIEMLEKGGKIRAGVLGKSLGALSAAEGVELGRLLSKVGGRVCRLNRG